MLKALLTLLLAGLLWAGSARATGLVADLSHHLIAITTAFSGTDVLLFGAVDQPPGDVAVVIKGPPEDETVRRKSRVGFVWLNTQELRFRDVPGYYAVASSRPLDEIAAPHVRQRHELGVENLRLRLGAGETADEAELAAFQRALIRNKQRQRLYSTDAGEVTFLGDTLFRTRLAFPANVPPGSYQVQVLQFRNGSVVNAQSSVLVISKVGLEAELYDVAQQRAGLYGLGSILLAIFAGWSASVMFSKR
ncbi:MAG TPA: TIGR02186 family protein [Geminicoccaceae bacterium]|nr:TIGR02186 family protein [Geminicoccaceae bacterium]